MAVGALDVTLFRESLYYFRAGGRIRYSGTYPVVAGVGVGGVGRDHVTDPPEQAPVPIHKPGVMMSHRIPARMRPL